MAHHQHRLGRQRDNLPSSDDQEGVQVPSDDSPTHGMEESDKTSPHHCLPLEQGKGQERVRRKPLFVYYESDDEHPTQYQLSNRVSIRPSGGSGIGSSDSDEKQAETNDEEEKTDKVELPEESFGLSPETRLERRGLSSCLLGGFDLRTNDTAGSHVDV